MHDDLPRSPEWMPEAELRDALLREKLPQALRGKNLFWINVGQYLKHEHADLPPEDYLNHWKAVYDCCLTNAQSDLRRLSYISFEPPAQKDVQ